METSEYEFVLEDRLAKIRAINEQYDLEHNGYISYSGGKDSVVLSHLVDLALPGNTIPRVFGNTGIEYNELVKYVKNAAKQDTRILIINNKLNIKRTLKEKGYPFKSKDYSLKASVYFNNQEGIKKTVEEMQHLTKEELTQCFKEKFQKRRGIDVALAILDLAYRKEQDKIVDRTFTRIPKALKYQFTDKVNEMPFRISDRCCVEFKEKLVGKWAIQNSKTVSITGLMKEEGGRRVSTKCTTFDAEGKLKSFAPMSVITKEWENEFVERESIILCKLYYAPFNFERTGCKGCPFAKDLRNVLAAMRLLLPKEYKQCLHLWKPVYDEYIRIGYRLKQYPYGLAIKYSLFDYENEDK